MAFILYLLGYYALASFFFAIFIKVESLTWWNRIQIIQPVKKLPTPGTHAFDGHRSNLAKTWLRGCVQDHVECRSRQEFKLPRRVIDVHGKSPHLFIPPPGSTGKWVALSHCWGEGNTYKTTRETLEALQHGLDWESLPQTYRDAIMVTRALGYRYLWIDSLCIIQDDDGEDFHVEASKMCDIYRNSDLTLSAACSDSDLLGFLTPRREKLRKHIPEATTINHKEMLQTDPIHTRAWTFQEHILPRRLLSFGTQEMFWECEEARECECSLIDRNAEQNGSIHEIGRTAYRKYTGTVIEGRHYIGKREPFADYFYAFLDGATEPDLKAVISGAEPKGSGLLWGGPAPTEQHYRLKQRKVAVFNKYWRRTLIPEYTRRSLTKYEDRLIALQAIAVDIKSHIRDSYLGGLWKDDFLNQLCWVGANGNTLVTSSSTPSWSWASISGAVEPFMNSEEEENKGKKCSPILNRMSIKKVCYEATGLHNCGRSLDGWLEVSGSLLEATVTTDYMHSNLRIVRVNSLDVAISFHADTTLSVGENRHLKRSLSSKALKIFGGKVSLLIVKRLRSEKTIVLVLGLSENIKGELSSWPRYTRLGIGACSWGMLVNARHRFVNTQCWIV